MRELASSRFEDHRDNVFGIQGLLQEQDRMQVDYTKSDEEVFYAAAFMIRKASYLTCIEGLTGVCGSMDMCNPTEFLSKSQQHLAELLSAVRITHGILLEAHSILESQKFRGVTVGVYTLPRVFILKYWRSPHACEPLNE